MSIYKRAVHLPMGEVAARHWKDWVSIAAGLVLALSPLWTQQVQAFWLIPLGVLLIVFGVWSQLRERASEFAEGMVALVGAFTIASPWIGGFAGLNGLALTAWIVGVVAVVMALVETIGRRRRVVDAHVGPMGRPRGGEGMHRDEHMEGANIHQIEAEVDPEPRRAKF